MFFASFVRPEGIYNSWFNKIVALATRGGSFCHSEFVFRWTQEELAQVLARVKGFASLRSIHVAPNDTVDVAIYILWGGNVQYRILRGHGEFWTFPTQDTVKINTSWENELNTVTWLANQIGAPYDHLGAVLYGVPLRKQNIAYDSYFCSQLMACALQRLNMLTHINPASLTPNGLYRHLQNA